MTTCVCGVLISALLCVHTQALLNKHDGLSALADAEEVIKLTPADFRVRADIEAHP